MIGDFNSRPQIYRKRGSGSGSVPVADSFNFDLIASFRTRAFVGVGGVEVVVNALTALVFENYIFAATIDPGEETRIAYTVLIDRFVCPSPMDVTIEDLDGIFSGAFPFPQSYTIPANSSAAIFQAEINNAAVDGLYQVRVTVDGCNTQVKNYYIRVGPAFDTLSTLFNGPAVAHDEYMSLAVVPAAYQFTRMDPFSVSVWLKLDSSITVTNNIVIASGNLTPAQSNRWLLNMDYQGTIYWAYAGTGMEIRQIVGSGAPLDEWFNLVVTWDNTNDANNATMYFNGVAVVTTKFNTLTTDIDVFDFLSVGINQQFTGVSMFTGNIDELAIWDKQLLLAEVDEIYHLGPRDLSTSSMAANLIAWWRMGEGAVAPTMPDEVTGGALDLTMVNMDNSNFVTDVPL